MTEQHPPLLLLFRRLQARQAIRFPEGAEVPRRRWSARVRGAWVSGRAAGGATFAPGPSIR